MLDWSSRVTDEDRSRQIGRRVLKPKPQYTANDAHNALTDLNHLELLIATRAIEHDGTFGLCTQDKGLAMLWCALAPRYASYLSPGIEYIVKLDKRLLARLDDVFRLRDAIEQHR